MFGDWLLSSAYSSVSSSACHSAALASLGIRRVVAKSAFLRFCLRQKLRTLPCSSFPQKIFDFLGTPMFGDWLLSSAYSSVSSSACHSAALASLGIRQSPRGESAAEPTLGPSGRQLRLNCWEKKRR